MRQILKTIRNAALGVLDFFRCDDLAVMSREVREILANKSDAKKYKDAVNSKRRPITVTFENGNTITLI
jgi:hypothetical protein